MRMYYTDHFNLPLPEGHRFPMAKYRLLRQRVAVADVHANDPLIVPHAATDDQLAAAHLPDYINRVQNGQLSPAEIRRIGFPWSAQMTERSRRSTGATLAAARAALLEGVAANLAGGTHHAFADCGEGYCVFNDAAVTLSVLHRDGAIGRGVVIDCDVHQGNGTASILHDKPFAFTFSIHGERNFPLRKFPSSLDIDLPDGTEDNAYLMTLASALDQIFAQGPFDLAIYLAGADPFEGDRLGRLKLTKSGLQARDQMVIERCIRESVPVAIAMAGGYAHNVEDIVDIHAATLATASQLQRQLALR